MERAVSQGNLSELVKSVNNSAISEAFSRNTKASQNSALNSWVRFCEYFNVDWMVPVEQLSMKETQNILISYLGFEIGLRGMNPNSIKTAYLGSISNSFVLNGIENYFDIAHKSKLVKLTLAGYLRIYHRINPLSGERKLAFTLELVKCFSQLIKSDLSFKNLAIDLAMKFGIFFLLRKSEYLPHGKGERLKHSKGLKWENIKLFDSCWMSIPLHHATSHHTFERSLSTSATWCWTPCVTC